MKDLNKNLQNAKNTMERVENLFHTETEYTTKEIEKIVREAIGEKYGEKYYFINHSKYATGKNLIKHKLFTKVREEEFEKEIETNEPHYSNGTYTITKYEYDYQLPKVMRNEFKCLNDNTQTIKVKKFYYNFNPNWREILDNENKKVVKKKLLRKYKTLENAKERLAKLQDQIATFEEIIATE